MIKSMNWKWNLQYIYNTITWEKISSYCHQPSGKLYWRLCGLYVDNLKTLWPIRILVLYTRSNRSRLLVWFSSIIWYPVCFMIEFDTHDVLCLVSKYHLILSMFYDWVWYSWCFMIEFDIYDVLCLVSKYHLILSMFYDWVWYSWCFMIEFDTHDVLCLVFENRLIHSMFYLFCQDIFWYNTWYIVCNISRLPFWSLFGYCLQGTVSQTVTKQGRFPHD